MNLPDLLEIPPSLPPELIAARNELERAELEMERINDDDEGLSYLAYGGAATRRLKEARARVAELERKEMHPK